MKKLFLLLGMLIALSAMYCKKYDAEAESSANSPRTTVPDEIVGAWDDGSLDFVMWENYREGYWAGRNAAPSREAMIFSKNGDAKFYRYEFAFGLYEELVDCTGTVTFNNDGTFTFYATKGRKRFYDPRYAPNNKDRALTAAELAHAELSGKRGYTYNGSTNPPTLRISVHGSAPYNWYKKY